MSFSHHRPSAVRSATASITSTLVSIAVYLAVTPFLIGMLGAGQYGVLALLSSMMAMVGSLDLGLVSGGILHVGRAMEARDSAKTHRLYCELFSVFLYLGAGIFVVIWLLTPELVHMLRLEEAVGKDEAAIFLRIAAASVIINFVTLAASIIPRALEQFPLLAAIQIGSNLILWGGAVPLFLAGLGLKALMLWSLGVGGVVSAIYLWWNHRAIGSMPFPVLRFTELDRLVRFSLNTFLTQMASVFTYHADKFLVAAFLGPRAVTYYAIAANISSKLVSVGAAFTAFVFPRTAALHAERRNEHIRRLYGESSRYLLLLIAPLIVPVVLLTPMLLQLWLGSEATEAVVPMQILLVAYFVTVFSIIPSQIYNGMGKTRLALVYAGIGTLSNIALCVVFIPVLGVTGAAVACLVGMLPSIFLMISVEQLLGISWVQTQMSFYVRLLLVLSLQAMFAYAARTYITDWLSLGIVGAISWALFYFTWFVTPLANEQDRKLVGRLGAFWKE